MNAAQTGKFGVFQTGYHSENPLLFAVFELGLKADHIAQGVFFVVLSQLYHGIRFLFGVVRIGQPYRFHRAEHQRLDSPFCHNLNRQAAVKIRSLFFKVVKFNFLGAQQSVDKSIIFFLRQRAVYIVKLVPFVIAGLIPCFVEVDAFFINDRCNCVIKIQSLGVDFLQNACNQGF